MKTLVISVSVITLVATAAWWYLVLFTKAKDPDIEDIDDSQTPQNQNPAEQ